MASIAAAFLPIMVLLVLLAVAEGLMVWVSGLGLIPWLRKRTGRTITSAVYHDFTRFYQGDKQIEIDQLAAEKMLREEDKDGAPPRLPGRVDLDSGIEINWSGAGFPSGRDYRDGD